MATIADLMRVEGRAELVKGEIVRYRLWGVAEGRILTRVLRALSGEGGPADGQVFTSTLAYELTPPLRTGRQTISPAISWYGGPDPEVDDGPVKGPPTFAVEFSDDLTPERRADYFEAGTLVVWGLDSVSREVRKFIPGRPTPDVYRPGDVADAESAVPGWRMAVDQIFR